MDGLNIFGILVDLELAPVHQDEALPSGLQGILAVVQVPAEPRLGIRLGLFQSQEDLLT